MASTKFIKSPYLLPQKYSFRKVLGEGAFGCVLKCWKKDTKEIVAVKIPTKCQTNRELLMMKKLMSLNFQQRNIIKYLDSFNTPFGHALVMEELDISIEDYIAKIDCEPMLLSDIRSIIQQTATALVSLKSIGVIHTDVKLDNMMLVNHKRRPLRVKLIDFGLAMYREQAKLGMKMQAIMYRAPEIILGLPLSEAIDMWSLGIVMAAMITGCGLFPGDSEYRALQEIVHCLGQPEDQLLNDGLKSTRFFIRTATNSWRLKTPEEYWGPELSSYTRPSGYRSLNDLKKVRQEKKNEAEAIERVYCIELLKAMLTIDGTRRITPCQVLIHPFIDEASAPAAASCSMKKDETEFKQPSVTRNMDRPATVVKMYDDLSDFSLPTLSWLSTSEDSGCGTLDTAPKETETTNIQPDHRSPSPTIPSSRVMCVQPASAENTLRLEDQESVVSLQTLSWLSISEDSGCGTLDTAPKETETTNIQPDHRSPSPTIPSSRVMCVQPASAENTLRLEDQESVVSLPTLSWLSISEDSGCGTLDTAPKETETTNIQPDHRSPSPTIPSSRVMCVQPASAENTLRLEDQESVVSLPTISWLSISEDSGCGTLDTAPKETETTNIQPDHRSPSPTIPSSRVIYVRPASAENTLRLEDQESVVSLQAGLRKTEQTSEPSLTITENSTVTENDTMISTPETSTTCDETQSSQSPPPVSESSRKKKKKKNFFRRFFSWLKKTCLTPVDNNGGRGNHRYMN